MDMDRDALQKAYTHVNSMLYNTSPYSPGKMQIRKNIHTT